MHARFAIAASIAAAALLGVELIAQTTTTNPTAPPMTSVLAGKKLTPPIRGEAALEWVDPKPEKKGDMIVGDRDATVTGPRQTEMLALL